MAYEYSDIERILVEGALPDVEVFTLPTCRYCGDTSTGSRTNSMHGFVHRWGPTTHKFTPLKAPQFFYAFGFPGCLWDSEPVGPFDTYADALNEARDQN